MLFHSNVEDDDSENYSTSNCPISHSTYMDTRFRVLGGCRPALVTYQDHATELGNCCRPILGHFNHLYTTCRVSMRSIWILSIQIDVSLLANTCARLGISLPKDASMVVVCIDERINEICHSSVFRFKNHNLTDLLNLPPSFSHLTIINTVDCRL